ncbi:10517_t:CDS:2, partial [Gigaspora rosea]
ILENHMSVISNAAVFDLLEDEDFYMKCHQISVILKPVKELPNCLEAKTANLADIFIGHGLKRAVLDKIYETAALIWNDLHYSEELCTQLLVEMRIEDMAKIRSYYLSNSDKKLQLYDKNLNNEELYESINTSMVTYDLPVLETLDDNIDNGETNEKFLASGDAIFSSEPVTTNRARDEGNMNYDPIESVSLSYEFCTTIKLNAIYFTVSPIHCFTNSPIPIHHFTDSPSD